jgi:hypothetical protein
VEDRRRQPGVAVASGERQSVRQVDQAPIGVAAASVGAAKVVQGEHDAQPVAVFGVHRQRAFTRHDRLVEPA